MLPVNLSVRSFCTCIRADSLPLSLGQLGSAFVDLSKATKLKDVVFRPESKTVEWVTVALKTVTPAHRDLRQISIHIPYYLTLPRVYTNLRQGIGKASSEEWLDLDRLLVQLWESRSIRPRFVCMTKGTLGVSIGYYLPEMTRRGIGDLGES
jgi:hypothetical protein